MEQIFNISVGLSELVGVMVKLLLVMISLVSMMIVRQTSLMNRVVSVPVGRGFVYVAWMFAGMCVLLTAIVVVVG